jgi:hypothetical protein
MWTPHFRLFCHTFGRPFYGISSAKPLGLIFRQLRGSVARRKSMAGH